MQADTSQFKSGHLAAPSNQACICPGSIAFDVDDVVADTISLFLRIAKEDYRIEGLRYEDITRYSLMDAPGLDADIVEAIITRLLNGWHHQPLQAFAGAPEVLKRLGHARTPILFVTARPYIGSIDSWICRTTSLAETAIKVVATGSFDGKVAVLREHGITHFVEDRLETCEKIHAAGITPILFKRPWNRHNHSFIELDTWQELEALIAFE